MYLFIVQLFVIHLEQARNVHLTQQLRIYDLEETFIINLHSVHKQLCPDVERNAYVTSFPLLKLTCQSANSLIMSQSPLEL